MVSYRVFVIPRCLAFFDFLNVSTGFQCLKTRNPNNTFCAKNHGRYPGDRSLFFPELWFVKKDMGYFRRVHWKKGTYKVMF